MKSETEIREELKRLTQDAINEKNFHLRSMIFREIDILTWVLSE